jgi:tryptophan halogenase
MDKQAISSVVVAGGGIVGWSAAAALKRHLPVLDVTLLAIEPPPDALADRIGCTLPSIVDFHQDLGLSEADTVVRAGSGYRLGTRFEGWAGGQPDYVHAYGEYGEPAGGVAFHQHWLRAATSEGSTFGAFSFPAVVAAAGRFAPPQATAPGFGYGLHIDPPAYREMMRAFALHLGASERRGTIAGLALRDDGFVDALMLDDGGKLAADLFVDTTGPAALVRGEMGGAREDWSQFFVTDRLLIGEAEPPADPSPLDRVTALDRGWIWEAESPRRRSLGLVYSSRYLSDADAAARLSEAAAEPGGSAIQLRPGRLAEPWLRNCVAIGDSAVTIESLEWTNLHLALSAIDRLVAMMPDRDCSPVELWDYNRQATAEADRVRDFVMLHYVIAERPGDFWRDASSVSLPGSLDHTLTQFRERGRLPFYEEETFARDSWLAVLLGQGVTPRRLDPLLEAIPAIESERMMAQIRTGIAAAAERLPSQSEYLHNLAGQAQ